MNVQGGGDRDHRGMEAGAGTDLALAWVLVPVEARQLDKGGSGHRGYTRDFVARYHRRARGRFEGHDRDFHGHCCSGKIGPVARRDTHPTPSTETYQSDQSRDLTGH